MALKSTIFKAALQIADIDHHYYSDQQLTLARHPSETDTRLMVRLVALACEAYRLTELAGDGQLSFGAGLSSPEEPDVWIRSFTGQVCLWVEVGLPDERPIAKACGRAQRVAVYAYGQAATIWWQGIAKKLQRFPHLEVWYLPLEASLALPQLAARTMQLNATNQDAVLTLSDGQTSVAIDLVRWK